MKKTIKMYLELFHEKILSDKTTIIKLCFMRKWYYLLFILFASCSVQNEINKDDFKRIPKNFSGSFYDKLDTIKNQYDNRISTRSFIKDFSDLETIDFSKPIRIKISNEELFLNFEDINKKKYVLKFYGKRFNKKFVFYTNYKTITFPIIFIRKEMSKHSIYWSDTNEIIFVNTNVNGGMFLFFGAENSWGIDYKFKLLKNE